MKDENIDSSLAADRSPVLEEVKSYAERRVKLNDTFIKSLKRSNKLYSYGDSEMVGLRMYIEKTGTKTFYYTYRPKNEKNFIRYRIGSFNILNVKQARDKAKKYAHVSDYIVKPLTLDKVKNLKKKILEGEY